jgi:tRNA A37 threonylcarbamoyladenosine dehydratase
MSKKKFHCQAVTHAGIKSISITDDAHHFCLTLDDANTRLNTLKEAIATGKYPIAMELVNSCAKLMTGPTVKYYVTQNDAEKFEHSLDKALHH